LDSRARTSAYEQSGSAGPSSLAQQLIFPGEDIQSRVDAVMPGTTFLLKSGVHRMQSIVPRDGDTFIGEPGTILSGARLLTTVARSGSFWVTADQTQEGPRKGNIAEGVCRASAPRCGYPEDLDETEWRRFE
jgi:hypothetical protein